MNLFYVFLIGYLMGISLAAPPGPVNAIMANESLKTSIHGTSVGAGAMTADAIFMIIVFFLRSEIPSFVLKYFYIAGGLIMIYLSYAIIKSKMPSKSKSGNYIVGLTMGITNPFQITWWLTAGLFLLNVLSWISVIGFFSAIVTWIVLFPTLMSKIESRYAIYVKIISSLILIIFGIYMLYYGANQMI